MGGLRGAVARVSKRRTHEAQSRLLTSSNVCGKFKTVSLIYLAWTSHLFESYNYTLKQFY